MRPVAQKMHPIAHPTCDETQTTYFSSPGRCSSTVRNRPTSLSTRSGISAALPLFALVLLTLAAVFGRLHRLRRL